MESQKEIQGHAGQLPIQIVVDIEVDDEKCNALCGCNKRKKRFRTPGT